MFEEDELDPDQLQEAEKMADAKVSEIGIEEIAGREQMRTLPIRKCRETYWIPFNMLKIREGFNVRVDMGDIEELAMGIVANGLHTEPLEIDLLSSGTAYIVDGHRRYHAFSLLKSKGHNIVDIECFINDKATSEEDRIVAMFVTQNNQKLAPLEVAACLMRLKKRGLTLDEIAERIGKSRTYVKRYLRYERQPLVIKELIKDRVLDYNGIEDLLAAFPNEKERVKFVEKNLVPLAKEGVKIEVARKGSASFVAERVRRLQEMEGIFSLTTRNKIMKLIKYLQGDIDEVDLVNL